MQRGRDMTTTPTRRLNPIVFVLGILVILAIAMAVAGGGRGAATASGPGAYVEEYGGSINVYTQISTMTDCDELQDQFDQAAANNDAADPGTDEHRWTLGYMQASLARMEAVGCS